MDEVKEVYAGHYQVGGSDKVWAGMVIEQADGSAIVLACWGKRGSSLQAKTNQFAELAAAVKLYEKKKGQKQSEGYQAIDPALYGIRATLCTLHPTVARYFTANNAATPPVVAAPSSPRLIPSHVSALRSADLARSLANPEFGVTEKVNGSRCLVSFDGSTLCAYNRRSIAQPTAPDAAQALARLGRPFVIDGERMEGAAAGQFVMFDLLSHDGASIRHLPYVERITLLETMLTDAGLIERGGATVARAAGPVPGLVLLTPAIVAAEKAAVLVEVQAAGGEGIIVRTLQAPALEGDTPHERKLKFGGEIDVIAIAVKPGLGAGSVRLGLLRPADGALIEVGAVRSGLRDADVEHIARLIAAGEQPVLRVEFLPARTVGITLVEPKARLRDDKLAASCTTDQLIAVMGEERAGLIAAARRCTLPAAA